MTNIPTPRKTDRRIQRTRQMLRDALMELVVEKGYETISIQDITDRANVARTTFYLHFKDKEDLLLQSLKDEFSGLLDNVPKRVLKTSKGEEIELLDPAYSGDFEYLAQYADFFRAMFGKSGSISFIHNLMEYLIEVIKQNMPDLGVKERLPDGLIYNAMVYSQIGIITWWLNNLEAYTPQEMSKISYKLTTKGVWWALGIDGVVYDDIEEEFPPHNQHTL
jgi:AcrR family transcriptional regulator